MSPGISRIYLGVVQFSIVALTISLAWFAFVYYPRVINDYRTGNFPKRAVIASVSATSKQFPIETGAYRIVFEKNSNTYYAFMAGDNLDTYLLNRNGAKLALKTALSLNNLCTVSVVYSSTANLTIPKNFQGNEDC